MLSWRPFKQPHKSNQIKRKIIQTTFSKTGPQLEKLKQMKISHNNHTYLSPSKLNSLTTLPVSVKTLLSPPTTDNTYTAADLDELIVSNSNTLSKYYDDERNENAVPTPKYTRYTALTSNQFNKAITSEDDDETLNYLDYNGCATTDPLLITIDPDHSKLSNTVDFNDTTATKTSSSPSIAIESITIESSASIVKSISREFSINDYSPLNRLPNTDDLLLTPQKTATTTTTSTASGTLNSRNGTNSDFARKELAQNVNSTRKPLLSTQNRFLSLSISPPLSRRQDMPVLRGTFVSL